MWSSRLQTHTCNVPNALSWPPLIGMLMFNAGLTPLVLSLWQLLTGYGLSRARDAVKVLVSGSFFAVGCIVFAQYDSSDRIAEAFFGGLFEIGALFFVTKFFFVAEDDEKVMKELKQQLQEALASPGTGLAMSYFYNFLLPTSLHLQPEGDEPDENVPSATVGVEMEVARGQFVPFTLAHPTIWVVLPRNLQDSQHIKETLRVAQSSKLVAQGRPQKTGHCERQPPTHVRQLLGG